LAEAQNGNGKLLKCGARLFLAFIFYAAIVQRNYIYLIAGVQNLAMGLDGIAATVIKRQGLKNGAEKIQHLQQKGFGLLFAEKMIKNK
jgi:hypothetical protein